MLQKWLMVEGPKLLLITLLTGFVRKASRARNKSANMFLQFLLLSSCFSYYSLAADMALPARSTPLHTLCSGVGINQCYGLSSSQERGQGGSRGRGGGFDENVSVWTHLCVSSCSFAGKYSHTRLCALRWVTHSLCFSSTLSPSPRGTAQHFGVSVHLVASQMRFSSVTDVPNRKLRFTIEPTVQFTSLFTNYSNKI